ncbi:MAG: hypothetical protein ACI9R3_001814 [Verrucomicrobiales bacterium]|jgi:hypothetical protein
MLYPEAGTFSGDVRFTQNKGAKVELVIPKSAHDAPGTIHVILTVEDDGNPSLVAYRRAIISIVDSDS